MSLTCLCALAKLSLPLSPTQNPRPSSSWLFPSTTSRACPPTFLVVVFTALPPPPPRVRHRFHSITHLTSSSIHSRALDCRSRSTSSRRAALRSARFTHFRNNTAQSLTGSFRPVPPPDSRKIIPHRSFVQKLLPRIDILGSTR